MERSVALALPDKRKIICCACTADAEMRPGDAAMTPGCGTIPPEFRIGEVGDGSVLLTGAAGFIGGGTPASVCAGAGLTEVVGTG